MQPVIRARRLALWAWARELGRWQSEMNGVLGLSSGAASHLLRRVSGADREQPRQLAERLWEYDGNREVTEEA